MPNENCLVGWKCPECGYEEGFKVSVRRDLIVWLFDSGTDDYEGGDTDWDNDAWAACGGCSFEGVVFDFLCGNEQQRDDFAYLAKQYVLFRKIADELMQERFEVGVYSVSKLVALANRHVEAARLRREIDNFQCHK